jgi:hypothetical protein
MNTSYPSSVATRRLADVDMARATTIGVVGITLVFSALVVPLILIDAQQMQRSLACDMLRDHLPQINFFIEHPWNFVDYPGYSVSLPGHHILLAWAARALGYMTIDSTTVAIRLLHATFGLVFSLVLFLFVYRLRRDDPHQRRLWVTFALLISVVPSFYFVQASVFLSTDMPAATIYLVFLYLITFHSQATASITLGATALVFWRQCYAPMIVAPFLANPHRIRATLIGPLGLTLAVPAVVLSFYTIQFGEFAPRNSIKEYVPEPLIQLGWNFPWVLVLGGIFPQSILHAFAFLGLISPIYLTIFSTVVQTAYRSHGTIIAASVISLLIATIWIAVPSTFDPHAGRWGSVVWSLSRIGPSWGNHSLIVLLLGIIGAAFMAPLMHLALSRDEVRPALLGMLLYIAGQIFMPLAFQRYVEPLVLLSLAVIAASSVVVATWRVSLFALIFVLYSLAGLLRIYNILPDIWLIASFGQPCT